MYMSHLSRPWGRSSGGEQVRQQAPLFPTCETESLAGSFKSCYLLIALPLFSQVQRVSHCGPGCTEESLYFYCNASAICRMGFWVLCIVAIQVNYPSSSSPTETLLRLSLFLNNQVESSFWLHTSPKTSMNY